MAQCVRKFKTMNGCDLCIVEYVIYTHNEYLQVLIEDHRKNASRSSGNVILAIPIAFTQLGEPGGRRLFAPCVLAPQTMNAGDEPPVQQTSASLLFQSHADTSLDLHHDTTT